MIANCQSCGIIWTDTRARAKVDPKGLPNQHCIDCVTFEYPLYNQRLEYAKSLKLNKQGK